MSAMSERLRVVEGASRLPESAWQNLVVGHPAMRLEVLKAIENTAVRPLQLRFFLLEGHGGLAAAAVCEVITASATANPLDGLLFGRAAAMVRSLGVSTQPALVFKTPVGRELPLVLRPALATEQRRVLDKLLDAIEEHAGALNMGTAFIGITSEHELLQTALRERHFLASEIDPTAHMDIAWADFEGYLAYLRGRSKNSVQNVRKERNRNRQSGVSFRQLHSAADAEALYVIAREHYRYKNGTELFFGPQFLPLLLKLAGEDFLIFEAVRNDKCAAMLGVLRSGTVGWAQWIGVDVRDRPNDFTYANLMFYQMAECAPALGLKSLLYGTAVQKAKVRRGCRSLVSHLFYRPRSPIGRLLARPFLRLHQAWYHRKNA
jgi:predicted N-acyltransferase